MTDRETEDPDAESPGGEDPDDPADPFTRPDGNDDVEEERFERMEPEAEVDPFDGLDADGPDEDRGNDLDDDPADHDGGTDDPDGDTGIEDRGTETGGSPGATVRSERVDDEVDPFAELDVSADPDAPPGSVEDPFERVEMADVDMDEVWETLDDDTDLPPAASPEAPGPDTRSDDVVDKRVYCHRCPHFAEPPETACTLDDTDIVEVIGFDEFRLRGCPMVNEDGPGFDRTR